MIKKIAFILLIASVLSLFSCQSPKPGDEETTPETTEAITMETVKAETEYREPRGDRLIFFEDFEDCDTTLDNELLMFDLGWTIDTKENRAYSDNTAKYSVIEKDGNRKLAVTNNISNGTDSYVIILNDDEMGDFQTANYTYQYDVTYTGAANPDRYIALVSSYNGIIYNSFHFRNKGTGNNQLHYEGAWFTLDTEGEYYASNMDDRSIIKKLLGMIYISSRQSFNNISVSIRYQVNWEKGNSVYMRVNTPGYPGSGKWTLVSVGFIPDSNVTGFNPYVGGSAIALKVGQKQDGYIDNIIVWEGTGDEPEDKSNPLIKK